MITLYVLRKYLPWMSRPHFMDENFCSATLENMPFISSLTDAKHQVTQLCALFDGQLPSVQ